jgi:hypothetical protein
MQREKDIRMSGRRIGLTAGKNADPMSGDRALETLRARRRISRLTDLVKELDGHDSRHQRALTNAERLDPPNF